MYVQLHIRSYYSLLVVFMLTATISLSSCVSYRVQTRKLEGTEYDQERVRSLFWGIMQSPKVVTTPICDSLGSSGMSEVYIRRNFGDYLLSALSLGIYNPATLKWKCSKPCPKTGTM